MRSNEYRKLKKKAKLIGTGGGGKEPKKDLHPCGGVDLSQEEIGQYRR